MKKVVILIVSFILLFIGCDSNNKKNIDSSNESINNKTIIQNQEYSFGPMADLSKVDDKTKKELQDFLNNLGNPEKDVVSFNPIGVYPKEDGSLMIDLFIRNGNPYPVFNIDVQLELVKQDKVIGVAPFSFIEKDFGILPPNTSRPWTILYYPEDLKIKSTDLVGDFSLKSKNLQYEYEE